MKITAEPRSDQWNAEDFIGSPRTFTVAGVRVGTAEQKYDILLEGEKRVWRPPLTVLRLLMAGWGDDSDSWTGRRVTLFNEESVRFGKDQTGGIRISHMSDLPDGKPLRKTLQESRGKRKTHVIDPLPDAAPAAPTPAAEPLDSRIAKALAAFKAIGTEQDQLERRIGADVAEWTEDDVASLLAIYRAEVAAATEGRES